MELKEYRKKYNRTLQECADELDVQPMAVQRWENYTRQPIRKYFYKIAKMTKGEVMPNDFFPDINEHVADEA